MAHHAANLRRASSEHHSTLKSILQVRAALCSGLSSGPRNDAPDAALAMRQRWRLAELRAEEYAFVLLSQFTNAIEAQVQNANATVHSHACALLTQSHTAVHGMTPHPLGDDELSRAVLPIYRSAKIQHGHCRSGQQCWACATWALAAGSRRSAWQWRTSCQHGSAWASSATVTTPSGAHSQCCKQILLQLFWIS
jgi:surfactin synthase thioesterase subunit